MEINKKIANLRNLMVKNGIDTYLITKSDPHQSENAREFWNSIRFISEFTGSAGKIIITMDEAALWTDGRYAIQAREQTKGSQFKVFITSEPGTIDFTDYAVQNTPKNGVAAFDGRTFNVVEVKKIIEEVQKKNIKILSEIDLVGEIWENRPYKKGSKIFAHELKYAGKSRIEKFKTVREKMQIKSGEIYIVSSLDDIAWLFNLRCNDDETLCFESYACITQNEIILFADKEKLFDVIEELDADGITIMGYTEINSKLKSMLEKHHYVLYAPSKTSYALYNIFKDFNILELKDDITSVLKSIKNKVEIENTKEVSVKDGAALFKFKLWLKDKVKNGSINEFEASLKADALRSEINTFIRPSFSTICGYGPNGSLPHYRATEDKNDRINQEGFVVVDSGGNYLNGTTDITRTFVLGPITEEMRKNFTLVLKGHINLAKAKFLYGSTGTNVDILARLPLWEDSLDYKHGTGHGIGYALNCHEGPQRIHMSLNDVVLEEGMMISNEPGFYKAGEYGIRSENIVVVKEHSKSDYGRFMEFETLSFCPFDLEAVEVSLLREDERKWLNAYHKQVFKKISPYLDENEIEILKYETREI